jgi:hypothetical protein
MWCGTWCTDLPWDSSDFCFDDETGTNEDTCCQQQRYWRALLAPEIGQLNWTRLDRNCSCYLLSSQMSNPIRKQDELDGAWNVDQKSIIFVITEMLLRLKHSSNGGIGSVRNEWCLEEQPTAGAKISDRNYVPTPIRKKFLENYGVALKWNNFRVWFCRFRSTTCSPFVMEFITRYLKVSVCQAGNWDMDRKVATGFWNTEAIEFMSISPNINFIYT